MGGIGGWTTMVLLPEDCLSFWILIERYHLRRRGSRRKGEGWGRGGRGGGGGGREDGKEDEEEEENI